MTEIERGEGCTIAAGSQASCVAVGHHPPMLILVKERKPVLSDGNAHRLVFGKDGRTFFKQGLEHAALACPFHGQLCVKPLLHAL